MEPQSHKIVRGFLSKEERTQVLGWVESLDHPDGQANCHLSELSRRLKGKSYIFNQSRTELTDYITKFQSVQEVSTVTPPQFILDLQTRIAETIGLPTDNVFLQAVDMSTGGHIGTHYDASLRGYINYKCNVSVLSEDYKFYIGDEAIDVSEGDLYAFEASLYRHRTDEFDSRRVFLSFGFVVPYSATGRDENDPRVRLAHRIERYFQQQALSK